MMQRIRFNQYGEVEGLVFIGELSPENLPREFWLVPVGGLNLEAVTRIIYNAMYQQPDNSAKADAAGAAVIEWIEGGTDAR